MARVAVGAAALFALCHADAAGKPGNSQPAPGEFGHDDSKEGGFMVPNNVPPHDKCSVDCVRLCQEGLGDTSFRNMNSKSDCQNACYAHSIETPKPKTGPWDKNEQQGKYVQKVMAEYCDRGVCGSEGHGRKFGGLLQASAVKRHEEKKEGEAYSPGTWYGDPRAVYGGWPSGCESEEYYCQELCQNMFHKATGALGEHFGAGPNWSSDQKKCKQDCQSNWPEMKSFFDDWCDCFEGHGGDMHLENVPGLLQESKEVEPVDVGSFMQVPGEL